MQLPPSIELAGFIRHYLFLDLSGAATRRLRLFPDGSTGIVLNSSPNLLWNAQRLPVAFFYGQLTEYKQLSAIGPSRMVVIVFHPHGISRLLDRPAGTFNDQVVALDALFGESALALQQAVATADNGVGALTAIDNFFRAVAARREPMVHPLVSQALQLIQRSRGTLSIQQLTDSMNCQSRQLERKFSHSVGLSPKQYCTIVRTLHFVRSLHSAGSSASLTEAAYNSGYYDQAHGIREFRKATGLTPSTYLKNTGSLALNFLLL